MRRKPPAQCRGRLRQGSLIGALAAVALSLTSCTAPHPTVTFFGDRAAVTVEPELWCDVNTTALTVTCPAPPDTANDGHLAMHANQQLQINVPGDVANAPWLVVFEYVDSAGKAQNGRSAVITDGRLSYTLPSLGAGVQLTRVEVQSGLVPTQAADGSTKITVPRTWVVVISPK